MKNILRRIPLIRAYQSYLERKPIINKIKLTNCGGFELPSSCLFEDKDKVLEHLVKLEEMYKKSKRPIND